MLVLTRRIGERIHIGPDVSITVLHIQGDRIRIGIEAPPTIPVRREEQTASPPTPPPGG